MSQNLQVTSGSPKANVCNCDARLLNLLACSWRATTTSEIQNEVRFLGSVLEPPGRLKIRAYNHVAANQVSTHYVIENMQSVACLTWLQIKPF
jgi:hypothetical protein